MNPERMPLRLAGLALLALLGPFVSACKQKPASRGEAPPVDRNPERPCALRFLNGVPEGDRLLCDLYNNHPPQPGVDTLRPLTPGLLWYFERDLARALGAADREWPVEEKPFLESVLYDGLRLDVSDLKFGVHSARDGMLDVEVRFRDHGKARALIFTLKDRYPGTYGATLRIEEIGRAHV